MVIPREIGDQCLDQQFGAPLPDRPDSPGELPGAPIGEIIPVNAGDHHIEQFLRRQQLGDMIRFVMIEESCRIPARNIAEATGPGAHITEYHHRGGSAAPAFTQIGAIGLFTDRVEPQIMNGTLQAGILSTSGCPDLEPVGFAAGMIILRNWYWHVVVGTISLALYRGKTDHRWRRPFTLSRNDVYRRFHGTFTQPHTPS